MKYNLPCEIVRDLLPNYVDKQLSASSNESVNAHLEECKDCYDCYTAMNSADSNSTVNIDEQGVLKKTKAKIFITVGSAVLLFILLFSAVWCGLNWYVTSDYLSPDDYTVTVNKILKKDITITEDKDGTSMYFDGIESSYELRDDLVKLINEQGYIYQIVVASEKYPIDSVASGLINPDNSTYIEVWSDHKSKLRKKTNQRHSYQVICFDDISAVYAIYAGKTDCDKTLVWHK